MSCSEKKSAPGETLTTELLSNRSAERPDEHTKISVDYAAESAKA